MESLNENAIHVSIKWFYAKDDTGKFKQLK